MITGLNKEIDKMALEIENFKEMENKYIESKSVLAKLYEEKVIDSDGGLNA